METTIVDKKPTTSEEFLRQTLAEKFQKDMTVIKMIGKLSSRMIQEGKMDYLIELHQILKEI
jgi:hypothetical protein